MIFLIDNNFNLMRNMHFLISCIYFNILRNRLILKVNVDKCNSHYKMDYKALLICFGFV